MAKKKVAVFDVAKAVKANARERVGQPKPEKVIVSSSREERKARRFKMTLSRLLREDGWNDSRSSSSSDLFAA